MPPITTDLRNDLARAINTIGAWRAATVLAARPELAATAGSEAERREAVRIGALGGYTFDYLRFVREPREGLSAGDAGRDDDEDGKSPGAWRPAAGGFDEWPRRASELRVLDPCCGSGHFLVEALHLLVRLRMEEEGRSAADAIRAVVVGNLFGPEIDPRCTQIAAFNVALAAWKLAGAPIELPPLNIACSGLAPNASKDDWLKLADEAAAASGVPARQNLLGRDESLWSARARQGLSAVHDLFTKAPILGSLIDPRIVAADLLQADFGEVEPLLSPVLARESLGVEQRERAVAAQGMAGAAALLAGRYTLVITNVPYLGRGKQDDVLKAHLEDHFTAGKADLATAFVQRGLAFCGKGGTAALVTPQNWLFLTTYRKLREELLRSAEWNVVARLERILEGEPPCDLFVRWKPLHEQPIGWDPDIDDGVRLNIRPFLSASLRKGGRAGAGILRWRPNIHWRKDRGEEPKSIRPAADYPWFWSCPGNGSDDDRTNFRGGPEFDGSRWNDLHYTIAAKEVARAHFRRQREPRQR